MHKDASIYEFFRVHNELYLNERSFSYFSESIYILKIHYENNSSISATVEQLFQSEELLLLLTKLYLKNMWSDVAITPKNSEKEKNEKEQVSNQNKNQKSFQNI